MRSLSLPVPPWVCVTFSAINYVTCASVKMRPEGGRLGKLGMCLGRACVTKGSEDQARACVRACACPLYFEILVIGLVIFLLCKGLLPNLSPAPPSLVPTTLFPPYPILHPICLSPPFPPPRGAHQSSTGWFKCVGDRL